ncbi:MAG: carbon monoxide dehydrogenase subunit G [Caldilineales bacterium]|nr:carbon monoxide dehydrogenase subunit G [Caldilineales bacterium]
MELEGTYTFNAPRQAVWDAIMEPEVLASILPGCESLERLSENEYEGALNVRVGPVQGRFAGTVVLSELDEPSSFHMDLDGKGAAGFVKGGGNARLEESDGMTILNYSGEAQVGGRIASVGQRLLDTSAKSITRQSLESLDQRIQYRLQAETAGGDATMAAIPAPAAPTEMDMALGVAKDVYEEYVSEEMRPYLIAAIAGLGLVILLLVLRKLLSKE